MEKATIKFIRIEVHMRHFIHRRLTACAAVLLILGFTTVLGNIILRDLSHIIRNEAEQILHFYSENIRLQLQYTLNEADTLAQTALVMDGDNTDWFDDAAAHLLLRKEVRYVCLIKGDTIENALPESAFANQAGKVLKDLSYFYTLAKVTKDLVVEGPAELEGSSGNEKVFLFLQPYLKNNAYMGEVVLALDRDYVLEQLHLDYLYSEGYDYELWRVEPQNGDKEVIDASRQGIDFSQGVKTTFNLPAEWNLSIQPAAGWISREQRTGVIFICAAFMLLMLILAYSLYHMIFQRRIIKQFTLTDRQTGLYNYAGFTGALNDWLHADAHPIILFYFVFEGYNQISQLIGPQEENAFLQSIPLRLEGFIQSPFLAGRLGDGNFAIALREDMSDMQQKSFAMELSLELLYKVTINDKKNFLTANYQYVRCHPGEPADEEIRSLIQRFYSKLGE